MAGSISGSSPWTLTTMSASSLWATSARRSVPVSCGGEVISTLPPKARTASAIRSSSVATITSETSEPCEAVRRRAGPSACPMMSARALPSKRVDAYLAGITAVIFIGVSSGNI